VNYPQINVQQIISFYFVAKEKSFSTASEKLFVTQPAVTQQIKALEVKFGVKLVNIKRKRVYLTKAGERLLYYAEEVINHVTLAENFLKSYRVNNLQIGVACTLTLYLTPIIDKFKELHPSVKVAVRDGPSLKLIDDLLDFKLDICLVGTLREINKRLLVLRIPYVEQMVFVANPDYPLVKKGEVKWEDLVDYPLILQSEGSIARERIIEHFRSRNLNPLIGAEVDNVECAKELARQRKGVALMFLPNIKEELALQKLKIIPVTDGEIKIGIDIVRNQEMALSPLANAFLSVIKKHFAFFFSRENLLASKKVEEITESYNLDLRKKYKPK
jgi:DNA-binding transcriptional LysR family regulator